MTTARLIKDTEFAEQVWEVLNQVQTPAIRFEVMQDSKRVASIVPVAPPRKATLAELDSLFATLPRLGWEHDENDSAEIKSILAIAGELKEDVEVYLL